MSSNCNDQHIDVALNGWHHLAKAIGLTTSGSLASIFISRKQKKPRPNRGSVFRATRREEMVDL